MSIKDYYRQKDAEARGEPPSIFISPSEGRSLNERVRVLEGILESHIADKDAPHGVSGKRIGEVLDVWDRTLDRICMLEVRADGGVSRAERQEGRLNALEAKTRGIERDGGAAEDDGPRQEEPRASSDGSVYRKRTGVWTVCFTTGKDEKHESRYTLETASLTDLIKWLMDLHLHERGEKT